MKGKVLQFEPGLPDRRYGVYVTSHLLLPSQPERAAHALHTLCPEHEADAMRRLLAGQRALVREGRFEAVSTFAARLYSQGFQIELLPLD